MLQEVLNKNVVVSTGTTDFSHVIKGEVLDTSDSWLKIQTKKNIEYIKIDAIIKILVSEQSIQFESFTNIQTHYFIKLDLPWNISKAVINFAYEKAIIASLGLGDNS